MCLTVYGSMLLMSLYTWASYYCEQLTIDDTQIILRTVLGMNCIEISDIIKLKWRFSSILFQTHDKTFRLNFKTYSKDDQLKIIKTLYTLVPASFQEGWPHFCHRVALPLRDGKLSVTRTDLPLKIIKITRSRYDYALLWALPLSVLLAILVWRWLHVWHVLLLFPASIIASWLFLRLTTPKQGREETYVEPNNIDRGIRLCLIAPLISFPLVVLLMTIIGFEKSTAQFVALIPIAAVSPIILFLAYKSDNQYQAACRRAVEAAPKHWDDERDLNQTI